MLDPFVVHKPYVRGDVRIENHVSADWARTLDAHKIRWTFEVSPTLCFRLTELNQTLEMGDFGTDPNEVQVERLGDLTSPLVLQGHQSGNFRFRDLVVPVQNDLLVHCHECDNAFFSPSLDLPCGFCGAPKPFVLHYRRITTFGKAQAVCSLVWNMREVLEETQSGHESRGRRFSTQSRQPASDNLYADQMAEKASSRESGAWETLREDLAGPAFVHSWPEIGKIEALQADYPNFSEVCEFVIRKIGLSRHTPSQAVSLPNILLEGGPSTGKSSFTERLTSILVGEDYARIDLGQAATNFALVGSDSGFKGGKEGRILRLMAADATRRPVANPVVIFDEVDKALDESRFSPLKALLSLLEKRDAKRFTDEFFTVPVDASRINFFGLANTLQPLSQPLLSRFTIFQIDDYTDEQFLGVVIPAIYREWSGRFFPGTFPQSLSLGARQDIADAAGSVPRRVAAVLDQLVSLDHPELTPSPVWEGLAGYPVSPRGEAVGEARE